MRGFAGLEILRLGDRSPESRRRVKRQSLRELATGAAARGHRLRFRLFYYLAVLFAATVMAGVLKLAGLLG